MDTIIRWIIGFPRNRHLDHKVEGIELFDEFFRRNTILIPNGAEQYFAGIYPPRRAFVAYAQNVTLWVHVLKMSMLFFIDADWVNIWFANPLRDWVKGYVIEAVLTITILLFTIIGTFFVWIYDL